MNATIPLTVPPDVLADLEAVSHAVAAGEKPDPELTARVRERARLATEAVRRRNGVLNIAVDLVREGRDACG